MDDHSPERRLTEAHPRFEESRREEMVEPEAVAAMLRLKAAGWGSKRISQELGVSPTTVKRYLQARGWRAFKTPKREKLLDAHGDWLKERFRRHLGNADVVRQELLSEKGIAASLRTVERAVEPYRQELEAEARATVRFETAPGRQLQIDFGERLVERRGQGQGGPVRCGSWLFAAAACARFFERAPGELVCRA